jgi:hypothetical protein
MNTKTRLILIVALLGIIAAVLTAVLAQCVEQTTTALSTSPSPSTSLSAELTAAVTATEDAAADEYANQDDEPTVVVSLSGAAYERVAGVEAVHTTEYGSVVWIELTQSEFEELQAAEVEFEVRDATVLNIGEYSFDPRIEEPSLPEELTSDYDGGTPSLYLVQLYGPPKNEWFDKLEAEGVENLGYVGAETHRVRMTSRQAAKVERLDFVRWVGPYHPAYRISSSLPEYAATFESGMVETVDVMIYDDGCAGGTVDRTIEAIEALGGSLIDRSVSHGGFRVYATFVLPASAITPTARLNDVLWLEGALAEFILEDEMSEQVESRTGRIAMAVATGQE